MGKIINLEGYSLDRIKMTEWIWPKSVNMTENFINITTTPNITMIVIHCKYNSMLIFRAGQLGALVNRAVARVGREGQSPRAQLWEGRKNQERFKLVNYGNWTWSCQLLCILTCFWSLKPIKSQSKYIVWSLFFW